MLFANISQIPNWLSWAFVGTLIATGLWLVWKGITRHSSLLTPEALHLNLDNPEHLCGREDDLQALVAAVILKPLVFLEGEAGVGKSALVRAGLIPLLQQTDTNHQLVPVYINCYGDDWDQGLSNRLAMAIRYTLTPEECEQLGISDYENFPKPLEIESTETRSLLHRLHDQLGNKRLLLIFDQFDDYLVTHHQKFLRSGRWLTAKELISQNEFWCGVYHELEHRNLHCLFVTRRRWGIALEAVRFRLPVQRAVDLVLADDMAKLLLKLTLSETPVISNPSVGWTALKDLLIQDLTNRNRILPIQAALAFRSLQELSELSIEAYEAIGRLEGMETASIQNAVLRAAKIAGISEAQVHNALTTMVDETIPLLPKARTVNENIVFTAAKIDANRGTRLLTSLEKSGLIRRGLGSTTAGGCAWTLYHDYLARLVLSMQRHAGRWQRLLQARHHTFYAVEGLRAKWRSLLSPKELFGLLRETLFGRIVWNGYRFFGIFSTLRILPFIITLFLIFLSIRYGQDLQARNTADVILQSIKSAAEIDSPVAGDALRQFWRLAAADTRLKLAFVERSLLDIEAHPILIERLEIVTQSIFGLDPNAFKRRQAMRLIFSQQSKKITLNQQVLPYPVLLATAIYLTNPNLFAILIQDITTNIEAAMRTCRDPGQLIALSQTLSYVEKYLLANQVRSIAERLVEAMYANNDAWQIAELAQSLTNLGRRLPKPQLKLSAERLVGIMRNTTNRNLLINIVETLTKFDKYLPPAQAEAAAKYLVITMGSSTDPEKMNDLATVLTNFTKIMQPIQIQTVAQSLVSVMYTSKDREQLSRLRQTLVQLAQRLPQPEIVVEKLANYLRDSHDPDQRLALSQTVLELGKFLQSSQLKIAAAKLVEIMAITKNPDQLAELGNDLGNLVNLAKISDIAPLLPQIQTGTERLVAVMTTSTVPRHLAELGESLATFGTKLPKIQAEAATTRLVEAMRVSTAPGHLVILAQALSRFGKQLPPNAAQAGAERLLEMVETGSTDAESLTAIGQVLGTLCQYLTTPQLQDFTAKSLDMLTIATDSATLASLGQILGKLFHIQTNVDLKNLSQAAETASTKLITAMQSSTDWEQLVALGNALANIALAKKFTNLTNIKHGPERLIEAMRANTIPSQLAILGQTLYQFQQYLPAVTAQAAAERLISVMRTNTTALSLAELGTTLNTIINTLPPPQVQTIGDLLIEAMLAASDDEQLLQLSKSFNLLSNKLSTTQIQTGLTRLVEILQTATEHSRLITIVKFITSIGTSLSPNLAQTTAERLVLAMRATSDSEQLVNLGNALINLAKIVNPEARLSLEPHLETGAMRLVEVEQINLTLKGLAEQMSPAQLHTIADKLVEAIHNSSDWRKQVVLSNSLAQLGKLLPATSMQKATQLLITAMQRTTRPEAFAHLAKMLETLPVTVDLSQISSAIELLKVPLAVGETKQQIFKFINRLAGQNFATTDAFAAWANKNLMLNLSQSPISPFQ